jgi:hypothetical protein
VAAGRDGGCHPQVHGGRYSRADACAVGPALLGPRLDLRPQKNWETKQHPTIMAWQHLPVRYQARFKLWQTIVMTLMLDTPDYSAIHDPSRS